MVEVQITPSAISDIKNILDYVRRNSIQNAENLYTQLLEKFNSLKQFPERGSIVKEISNPELREIKLHHLRIIYKLRKKFSSLQFITAQDIN